MTRRPRADQSFTSGPWLGVYDDITKTEQSETLAHAAFNCVHRRGAFYARPGFMNQGGTQLGQVGGRFGQAVHDHTATDQTVYRFLVCGGKLYRWDGNPSNAPVDVTPVGVAIATTARVYLTSFGDQILVNDETNRPWRMTNLSATPVTGTYIDLDGAGSGWVARGRPTIYYAKAFFILLSVAAGTIAGTYGNTLVWSEEADASIGYRQSSYDNLWELTQSSTEPIYAIHGTNAALYYWRARSIGVIAGAVSANFQTSGTHDAVDVNVGTMYPATVVEANEAVWFADLYGRPYRMPIGGAPQPIWQSMGLAVLEESSFQQAFASLAPYAWASAVPDLDLVVFAVWGADNSVTVPAARLHAFSAIYGTSSGTWAPLGTFSVTPSFSYAGQSPTGIYFDIGGVIRDNNNVPLLTVLGTDTTTYSTANQGRLWQQQPWLTGFTSDYKGTAQTTHAAVTTQLLVDAAEMGVRLSRVSVLTSQPASAALSLSLVYSTSYNRSPSIILQATLKTSADQLDMGHARASFGLGPNAQGRWVRLMAYVDTTAVPSGGGSAFVFDQIAASGTTFSLNADAP